MRVLKKAAPAVTAVAFLLGGCAINNVDVLVESIRDSFVDDVSDEMRGNIAKLQWMAYAQMYVRLPDRKEAVFILSEHSKGEPDVWIGGNGVAIAFDAPLVSWTSGLDSDIDFSVPVKDGALAQYLRSASDDVFADAPSVVWMRRRGSSDWIEQVSWIEERQEVYFQGLAYTGPALRITEQVRTTGRPETIERRYWIETRTRTLLRMEGPLFAGTEPLVFEWIRVPDPSESR